ncbi:MAG TPA: ABC transporter ATP-binding protein [Actinomycetota bacterium]|nr:ABC transporter ATP-binding protein [Actinomycetota bacterium]
MLELTNVSAFYGPIQVLFGINLSVGDGEIVALLGTNGAGKTTILRVVSGILRPRSGEVSFDGESLLGVSPKDIVRRGIVQMPGGRGVFPGMTVQENLEIAGFLYGKDKAKRRAMIDRVFEFFPVLVERRRQSAGSMSGGQQQMLTLAKSFIMDPKLLLIDELSLGLAPKIVGELIEILQRLNAEGVAVVIVDQHVDLALDVAAKAYFIERGEIRFSGPSQDLRGRDDLLRSVFLRGESQAVTS